MKLFLIVLSIVIFLRTSKAVIYQLNDEEHERMPPTICTDPFAQCLRRPGGRYCTAYASYIADGDSTLLTLMQKYSDHSSSHFNHTRALFGTCLTHTCKDIDGNISDPRVFLEKCLNRTISDKYKLKVKVDEEVFCQEYGEQKPVVRTMDIAVAAILLTLVVCNVVGSLFDILCPNQDGLASRFLQSFSISRNWKMLHAAPGGSNPRLERLKGIYGIRAISMTLVIVAHALLPAFVGAENSKFIEDLYEIVYFHVLLNGPMIMQTFLFMSAFLLVYLCQMRAETHQVTWRALPMGILKRWLRLTPSYAVVLAVTATWIPRLNTGPLWNHLVVVEGESCRREWWQHIIYINNYIDNSRCMPQAWYLATDTQLYCLGMVIYVFCQSLGARKMVLSGLFVAGILGPALHTYYQDLDGPLLASPSAGVSLFATDRTFNAVYRPGHTNATCYVLGLVAGYLVYSLQRKNFDASKYKVWRLLYWALLPLGLAVTMFCKIFYSTPRVGILYRTACAALIKPVFGLVIALIIVGMIFKIENVYRGILEWSGWVTLSRVSYSAYLLHVAYIRVAYGAQDHPLRISYLRALEMVLFTVTVVYLAAYLFWLTVEAPLSQMVKTCLLASGEEMNKDKKKN